MKLKTILTCISLSCILAIASPSFAGNKEKNQVQKMQEHWEMIISEKNKNKRAKMINDHKDIMNQMEKSNAGHHMSGMSGHHMNNTIDMHRSMINIMK